MQEVTDKVSVGEVDGEHMPITKCVCGEQFAPWNQVLSVYKDTPWECRSCGVRLFFKVTIQVFDKE